MSKDTADNKSSASETWKRNPACKSHHRLLETINQRFFVFGEQLACGRVDALEAARIGKTTTPTKPR